MRDDIYAARRSKAHSLVAEKAEVLAEKILGDSEEATEIRHLKVPYPQYRELFLLEAVGGLLDKLVAELQAQDKKALAAQKRAANRKKKAAAKKEN